MPREGRGLSYDTTSWPKREKRVKEKTYHICKMRYHNHRINIV